MKRPTPASAPLKKHSGIDPSVAFPDAKRPPGEADLQAALGRASVVVETVLTRLRAIAPGVTTAWQFSERAGWYRVHLLEKHRLFYLVPKRGDFRVSLILGRKAVAQLLQGPSAGRISALLPKARQYPEGLAFSFNRRTLDPDLLVSFLAAKLAH